MIQRLPHLGSQVEILTVKTNTIPAFDKRHFCNMFPNLRIFMSVNRARYAEMQDILANPFTFVHPDSKLTQIRESNECELTRQMLLSSFGSRLTRLDITLDRIKDPRQNIFIYLNNAPALKTLKLYDFVIGIEDCEIIHKNTPNLDYFYLGRVIINPGELPHDIIPATSVKSFGMYITSTEDYDTYPSWYVYMANKYFGASFFQFSDAELSNVESWDTLKIYRDGILPLYQNNSFQKDCFEVINVPTEIDVFDTLFSFGYSIPRFILRNNEYSSIFKQLADSQQANIVTYIKLQNTNINTPIKLQNFTLLNTLEIDLDNYEAHLDVNLTDYFNGFPPSLTSFSAKFRQAMVLHTPERSNNVEKFSLTCYSLLPKLGDAISNCFPKLNDLYLEGVVEKDLEIDLPNHHFKKIDVKAYYKDSEHLGFTMISGENKKTRYYAEDQYSLDSVLPITAKEAEDLIQIYLEYGTTEKCFPHIAPAGDFEYTFDFDD